MSCRPPIALLHQQTTIVIACNTSTYAQAQARALVPFLGGKKRFKNVGPYLLRNTRAIVFYLQSNPPWRIDVRKTTPPTPYICRIASRLFWIRLNTICWIWPAWASTQGRLGSMSSAISICSFCSVRLTNTAVSCTNRLKFNHLWSQLRQDAAIAIFSLR